MIINKQPKIKTLGVKHFQLLEEYEVVRDNGTKVTIPQGYVTNGADIPRMFWRLFPPYSPEYLPAVIIHDYLCDVAEAAKNDKALYKEADDTFKEALKALGVSKLKVSLFYGAVRLHHRFK